MKDSNSTQALWVAVGSLSSIALGIVSAAILSRYFPKAEYGTYKQILYVYSTLLFIFTAGLPRVFSYYLPRFNKSQGKSIVKKISKILFLTGLVFSIVLFVTAPLIGDVLNNEGIEEGLRIFSFVPVLLLPTLGLEGIFSSYRKTIFIAVYNTLTRIITLLFIVLPVVIWDGGLMDAMYGWLVAAFITFLLAIYFKNLPFQGVKSEPVDLSTREILLYSSPIALASIWGVAIKAADQFYISRYFGPEVFAEFSNGFMELPFVGMVTTATSVVLMPVFSKLVHENHAEVKNELIKVWRSAISKSAVIIYPLVVFFIFYAKDLMVLLYSDAYAESGSYFQVNMVLNFFNIIIFAPLLFALGKTKFYANIHLIFALAIWLFGYITVVIFHSPFAVAILSVVLSIIKIIVFLIFIGKFLDLNFLELIPLKKILKLIVHTTLCVIIIYYTSAYYINIDSLIVEILIKACLYGILVLLTSKMFTLNYFEYLDPFAKGFLNVFSNRNKK